MTLGKAFYTEPEDTNAAVQGVYKICDTFREAVADRFLT